MKLTTMAAILEEVQKYYNEDKKEKSTLMIYDFKWRDTSFAIKLCKEYKEKTQGIINAKIEVVAVVTLEYEDNFLVDRSIEFFSLKDFEMLGYADDFM